MTTTVTAVSSLQAARNATLNAMDGLIQGAIRADRGFTPDERKRLDAQKNKLRGIDNELDIAARVQFGTSKFRSLGEELLSVRRAAIEPSSLDPRLRYQAAAQGAGEAIDSEGGFLVQTDFSAALMERVHDTGLLLSRTSRFPVRANANEIKIPIVDETSRADGSRWGGVQAEWVGEGVTPVATKPQLARLVLEMRKLIGLIWVTNELVEDSAALEEVITRGFTEEFQFKIDDAILNGDGVAKPLGILNAPATISVAKENGQAAGTITPGNIRQMWQRMTIKARRNAVWIIGGDIEPKLDELVNAFGTAGVPAYVPAYGNDPDAPAGRLKGRPIIPIEQAKQIGTLGDIVLADLSQYIVAEKDMIAAVSVHVGFLTDESAFRFVVRTDGLPSMLRPITPHDGGPTRSAFVTLAERT